MPSKKAVEEAENYVKHSIETQRKLGYRAKVRPDVYDAAVRKAASAMEPLIRLARSSNGHSAS